MSARDDLDRQMRSVLAQLETVSHVPAANWGPTGRSRSSDEPLGGSRPPGDLGHVVFARAYGPPFHPRTADHPGSVTDEQRRRVLKRAQAELDHIRGKGRRPRFVGETMEQLKARIVKDGEGFSVKEVALKMRCLERVVVQARKEAGREPDYGRQPEPSPDAKARKQRALELEAKGHTIAHICRLLGASRATIERDLGRRRAS